MILACLVAAAISSPLDAEIAAASADAARLGISAPQARYLTLYNVPEADRPAMRAAVSLLANSFSNVATITRPAEVSPTLLRIDLAYYTRTAADYRTLALAWDAVAASDRYLHLKTEVLDPRTGRRTTVFTDGGWLNLAEAAKLRALTGSAAGLLRADFFVATCCRPEAYHELANVPPTLVDLFKLRGVDLNKSLDDHAVLAANLERSGITDRERRLAHLLTKFGSLYITFDSAVVTADKDPFRNPTRTLNFDAGEYIWVLANGLHGYGLYDKAGKRQNAVPANIATDFSIHPPAEVVPMLSCVRCHNPSAAAAENGLRAFADAQREILRDPKALKAALVKDAAEVASLYARQEKLQKQVARDREDYAAAILEATGLEPFEAATALGDVFATYSQASVTPAIALAELGIETGDDPAETVRERLPAASGASIVRLGLGKSVLRTAWEVDFQEAALILKAGR